MFCAAIGAVFNAAEALGGRRSVAPRDTLRPPRVACGALPPPSAVSHPGLNALVLVLKREIVPPPPPSERTAEWYDDPCGRWAKRYWDGRTWTAHVTTPEAKRRGIDPPQT